LNELLEDVDVPLQAGMRDDIESQVSFGAAQQGSESDPE
jgi:hypothetical protein